MDSQIFNIKTSEEFTHTALKIFKHQFVNNTIYRSFCDLLSVHPRDVSKIQDIPFLPIEFFKSHRVISSKKNIEQIFTSSGTTGTNPSKHLVTDITIYKKSYKKGFEYFYENIKNYTILALLPNYLERKNSSLVYMIDDFIKQSKSKHSGFYLNNLEELASKLIELDEKKKKTLLIGVSFALLDLIEKQKFHLKNTIIMETGGMKGYRKEHTRVELHKLLSEGFGVSKIHSEYGMTELLSQAYSKGNGIFKCPPWMQILIRDPKDPLTIQKTGKTGGINSIDLANYNSCSFIATQDLGKIYPNQTFEILGRFDASDIRGCNLMLL